MDENTFIFLEADHGMRYGDWFFTETAHAEFKLPVFFFITPVQPLMEVENAFSNLYNNSFHLTSKLDIRLTEINLV